MSSWYNENDPYPAQWLRNLIAAGEIPAGVVDERSITDVEASDLQGHNECHFFAGIGGWPYALRLADWTGGPVWTGSCPCQPFSAAGKRRGHLDERHLWPAWFPLIRECRPPVIFGEQVASKAGLDWLDAVRADLEGEGYAVGAADLCAAGVGAPHIRQRIYFVAYTENGDDGAGATWRRRRGPADDCAACVVGHPESERRREGWTESKGNEGRPSARGTGFWSRCDWLPCRDGRARPVEPGTFPLAHGIPARVGRLRAYGNAIVPQVAAEFVRAFVEARDE